MPVSKDSKLSQAIDAFREWLPTVRVRFNEWFGACREEPVLLWHTPAIRYGTYAVAALIGVWLISSTVDLFAPGGPTPIPQARTAGFHVICADCGHHFVVNRKFGFDDFPVKCPKCNKESGQQAMRCFSERCAGKWVAIQLRDEEFICRNCGAIIGRSD